MYCPAKLDFLFFGYHPIPALMKRFMVLRKGYVDHRTHVLQRGQASALPVPESEEPVNNKQRKSFEILTSQNNT